MTPLRLAPLYLIVTALSWGVPVAWKRAEPEQIQEDRLRADAVQLAAFLFSRSAAPPETLPVSPPVPLIDSIHAGLISIFGLSHPARDSVFELHEIRAAVEGTHSALVSVDSLAPWLDTWLAGEPETGTLGVDSILGPLDVRLVEEAEISLFGDRDFKIHFRVPANWYVLRQRLMQVPAVQHAGPSLMFIGGGNHLVLERVDDHWRFRFSVAWGDCPSGCVNRHDWVFHVDRTGVAQYIGSFGDPLPGDGVGDSL